MVNFLAFFTSSFLLGSYTPVQFFTMTNLQVSHNHQPTGGPHQLTKTRSAKSFNVNVIKCNQEQPNSTNSEQTRVKTQLFCFRRKKPIHILTMFILFLLLYNIVKCSSCLPLLAFSRKVDILK